MSLEDWISLVLLINLSVYMNLGGTDFGARLLNVTSSGPRADEQRAVIDGALGRVWALNHLLFLAVIALLMVAFSPVITATFTVTIIPLSLLVGSVVVRLVALVSQRDGVQRGPWRHIYNGAGVAAPLFVGILLGALACGEIRINPETQEPLSDSLFLWLRPLPISLGVFTLTLCGLSASAHLTSKTEHPGLEDVFRGRALKSAFAVGALAVLTFLLSVRGAPAIHRGLTDSWWSTGHTLLSATVAITAISTLYSRRYEVARVLVMTQVALVFWGYGLAMQPHMIFPDLTFEQAAASDGRSLFTLIAMVTGSLLLIPLYVYLKRQPAATRG